MGIDLNALAQAEIRSQNFAEFVSCTFLCVPLCDLILCIVMALEKRKKNKVM